MGISLTKEQLEAYNHILNSKERVIVLLGRAGTGKTTVISQLAKNYIGDIVITATTNKAKTLLSQKTGIKARTIHSFCGYVMTKLDRTEILQQVNECSYTDFIIVDEISMLQQNIFKTLLDSKVKKILLVGDLLQLPAIGKTIDISSYETIYLTKNVRQENKEVSDFMEILRNSVSKKRAIDFSRFNLPKDIITYKNHKDFCKAYLDCTNSKRILAYSNKVVDSYNTNINNGIKFKVGELLVLDKPLGSAKNGDIAVIEKCEENETLYKLLVRVEHRSHTIFVFKTKKAEQDFFNDIEDNKTFWEYRKKTFNPKLVYASTIHKAQGDTIDEVFIDLSDIYLQLYRKPTRFNNYNKPISVDEYLKLVYVAISRMRLKAHLFIGEKREYKWIKQ